MRKIAILVVVVQKQPSFKQTSETVSGKRWPAVIRGWWN